MGKHSAPRESQIRPTLIKAGAVFAMASVPALFTGATAQAANSDSILAAIASCESGGKNIPTAITDSKGRRTSTAGGYFQIVNGTWRAHGGLKFAPTALQASYAEQLVVARNILNGGQGLGAWNESKNCWSKRIGKVEVPTPTPAPTVTKVTPPKVAQTPKSVAVSYFIKRGDTLVKIAARNGTTWRKLYNLNRDTVKNPALIYTGNHLRLR